MFCKDFENLQLFSIYHNILKVYNYLAFIISYYYQVYLSIDRCYFHVDNANPPFHFCPVDGTEPLVPRDAVGNPSVVSILLCEYI